MSINNSDIVDRMEVLLASAGYTFHDGPDDIPFGDQQQRHWFCWTDGKCDVEVGEDCTNGLEAIASAMEHWFKYATIDTENSTDTIGAPPSPEWLTGVYGPVAVAEGWGFFNGGEIQRDDEANLLSSDDEAIDHVRRAAEAGSLVHQAAIARHEHHLKTQERKRT